MNTNKTSIIGAGVVIMEADLAREIEDTADSVLIIIRVELGPKPGKTPVDIPNKNIHNFKDIVSKLAKAIPNGILIAKKRSRIARPGFLIRRCRRSRSSQ